MKVHSSIYAGFGAIFLAGLSACTGTPNGVGYDGGTITPQQARDSCKGLGFRQPSPSAVVCPGAQGCICATNSEVCCLQAVDSSKGACTSLGACRNLAIQCDGPEDCNPATIRDQSGDGGVETGVDSSVPGVDASVPKPAVCCLDEAQGSSGGGSSCRASTACTGKILCRTDDDCTGLPAFPHCRPADYGTPGVEDRGLDGLIGFCQR